MKMLLIILPVYAVKSNFFFSFFLFVRESVFAKLGKQLPPPPTERNGFGGKIYETVEGEKVCWFFVLLQQEL